MKRDKVPKLVELLHKVNTYLYVNGQVAVTACTLDMNFQLFAC